MLVEVVAVDPAEEDPGAVHEQVEARDLDPAEADLDRHLFDDRAAGVAQDDAQRVEARLLGGPALDVGDVEVPRHEALERRRHLAMDDRPGRLVLRGEQTRGRAEHDPLVVERPAAQARPVDRHGLGAQRLVDAVEVGLHAPAGREARGPGTRA